MLRVYDAARNPIPDASDQNKNNSGGEGNDGQGDGRGESPYVPDTPNDKGGTIPWTIGRDVSQMGEAVKEKQGKKEKAVRMGKHGGKSDAVQTTAQADHVDIEQLHTGKDRNMGSSQIKQSQSAILREFLTLSPAVLKDVITGEQYRTTLQSGNIVGEVWESSAPFLRILQRLFQ